MDAPKEYGSEARPTAEPSPMAGYAMSLARLTLALALVCGVAAVLSVSSEASRVGGVQQMADAAARASATDDGTVTLAMTNEYERSSGRQIGDGPYPFYVADVAKHTKLALSDGSATIWSSSTPTATRGTRAPTKRPSSSSRSRASARTPCRSRRRRLRTRVPAVIPDDTRAPAVRGAPRRRARAHMVVLGRYACVLVALATIPPLLSTLRRGGRWRFGGRWLSRGGF